MAKYDERIIKFLTQNADRAPTIVDMMNKLNINISDISESLASLLDQNLISKRMNSHGIECWFPSPSTGKPGLASDIPAMPVMPTAAPKAASATTATVQIDPKSFSYLPEVQAGKTRSNPVPVQHVQSTDRFKAKTQTIPAMSEPTPSLHTSSPTLPPNLKDLDQRPRYGVSLLTFAVGLVMAVAFSTWFSILLTGKEIRKTANAAVDQKTLKQVNRATLEFHSKTKSQIQTLERQIQTLQDDVAKLTSSLPPPSQDIVTPAKVAPPPKAKKAIPPKKSVKIEKSSVPNKPAKSEKLAKSANELSKISALRLKKKLAAEAKAKVKAPSQSNTHSKSNATLPTPTSKSDDVLNPSVDSENMPSVPQAPGISDQDLPPPPSE